MNILIADDDRFVVSALEKKINWVTLGVEKIYCAYNIRQAMKLFTEHPIDILISDIEMPQGSGLELLAWIRSEGYKVQTIYLTNFADFHYAQKAIELQSFEYYLKPIEFDKLELIIKKAIKNVKASQDNEEALKVGQYWQENKEELKEHFWSSHIKRSDFPFTIEELQEELNTKHIDYSIDDQFLPLLIELFPYKLIDNREIQSVFNHESNLRNQLNSIIETVFQNHPIQLDGFLPLQMNNEKYLAIFKVMETLDIASSQAACNELIETVNKQLHCDIQCYLGTVEILAQFKSEVTKLQAARDENINYRNKTFLLLNHQNKTAKYVEPNLKLLEDYLLTKNRDSFINRCQQYLNNLVEKSEANQHVIGNFKIDINQLIYTHLKKKEILAHHLFQGKVFDFLHEHSNRSIEDLMNYLAYLVDVSFNYMTFTNSQKSVVHKVCDYIDQNYHENITRTNLASTLYLSPDYIARIFKKEMGISLINYLIKKRIEVAKDLLTNTDHPVHLISDKVGYGNYSYFTKIFKKETNYTPMDYRKECQAPKQF
ncbi:response regulator transcription factor [Lederbergia panacisoli]|uniref:response regulator transcription factor n=1 Tax=Lederbergia panacisoli TaxID=1255251 RepID=UPI00214BF9FE|nr:response regulator [Lederbergia panacisoli]MCR2822970.1 response regulator [Lederbergia panacisoli]